MSALSMIRNNIGLVAVIIGISLLGFILTDLLSSANRSGGAFQGSSDAGTVAGTTITREQYAERVDQFVQQTQAQTGNITPLQRYQAENDAWNSLVSEMVFDQELENAGLKISGEEVYDMFVGENVSPIVKQYLAASPDQYNADQVRTILRQIQESDDPENPQLQQLKSLEDYVTRVRAIEQYQNAFISGYIGSKAAAQQRYNEQNKRVDISYLGVNYSQIPDSTVEVSDRELRAYISDHPNDFKQEEETFVSFVRFDVNPSVADSVNSFERLDKLKESFAAETRDSAYTVPRTRFPFRPGITQPMSDLPGGLADEVLDAEEKTVFGPYLEGKYYRLYKIVEIQDTGAYQANINHILIRPGGSTQADSAEARNEAASIRRQVNAANFAEIAGEKSQDFASKTRGGSLGWYRKGSSTYGPDFDKAVSNAPVGSIIGPVKSNQGYHVVQIVNKTRKTFSIANIEQIIYPTDKTRDSVYNHANRFAAKANELGEVEAAAAELGLTALKSNGLQASTQQITGLPVGRQLVRWALDADVGDQSTIIEINNDTEKSFVFGEVTERRPEGLQSIDAPAVRSRALTEVLKQKKAAIIKDKLAGQSGSLEEIKTAYGAGAFVSQAKDISFASSSIPGVGNDWFVVGKVMGMAKGTQSAPIEGSNGVFIIRIDDVREAASLDAAALASQQATDRLTNRNTFISKIEPALTEIADPQDTRVQAGY